MNKSFILAAVLGAAALTGIFSTNTLAAYASTNSGGDESETNTEQEIKQKNVGSGESTNTNCAQNAIDALSLASVTCPVTELLP